MLFQSKVVSLFRLGGKSQKSYCEQEGMTVQSLSQSLRRESLRVSELVNIANYLGLKVEITGENGKVELLPSDFSPKVDKRRGNSGTFLTKRLKLDKEVEDLFK